MSGRISVRSARPRRPPFYPPSPAGLCPPFLTLARFRASRRGPAAVTVKFQYDCGSALVLGEVSGAIELCGLPIGAGQPDLVRPLIGEGGQGGFGHDLLGHVIDA